MALLIAMAGAHDAAGQTVKERDLSPLPGRAPPANGATMRPMAAPDTGASGVKVVPLSRDAEPAAPAPGASFHTDAGLRGAFWRGTPFSLVAEALPRLPVRVTSRICHALTLEILTKPAEPLGGPLIAARLAALRAERLYAMGQLEAADALFKAASVPRGDPARAPAEIETQLLLHGPSVACAALAEHLAARRSAYLERANIACLAMAGAHAKAALALGLLRERGDAVGETFGGLIMAQQPDLARPLGTFRGADAWAVRLVAETRLPWPDDAMRLGSPALLRAIATSANDPVAVRLGAAERAFLLGALDRAALVALYRSVRFRHEVLKQAARLPLAHYTPVKRALLLQAATTAGDRGSRMEILANWWRLARADRGGMLAALVTAPLVSETAPEASWRENAAAISRVLFDAGELDRALVWYAWLRRATFRDMEAYMRLGAIAQLADTGGRGWTAAEAEAWADYQRAQASGERRIALMRALEEGLGAKGPHSGQEAYGKLARVGESIGAGRYGADRRFADWRDIHAAAQAGREGEAILLMLTALGHDGVARAEPHALGAAVGVLATLGRKAEARRLAVEAALANGF
ncbi:MAG TPA: hypothetical protein VIF14_17675 [Alphaproteobacteria bacterium]